MEKKFDLSQLKEFYKPLMEKYNLPSFEKLNEDFLIEKASESETDFILKEIRICITEKFLNYFRFIESIINPTNAPMFVFAIIKTIGVKEKEKFIELYKKIAKIEIDMIELDLEYSEKKEAEAIIRYYNTWQDIKEELSNLVKSINGNWDAKIEDNGTGYFG